jgi:intracellular septation protein
MVATALQLLLTRLITGHLEKRLLYMGAAVLVFGGATLALHDKLFIQWKPTIFNWAIAGVMVGTRLWTGRSAMQKAMGSQLALPEPAWRRLDLVWTVYFLVVGALNLVVAYGFSEATWVSYKFYSAIGFTILLSLLTVWLVMPYLSQDEEKPRDEAR